MNCKCIICLLIYMFAIILERNKLLYNMTYYILQNLDMDYNILYVIRRPDYLKDRRRDYLNNRRPDYFYNPHV
ncbi:hypothetical protein PFBG_02282 [Plasmodium falciparum 7G8]|uniref:Uncharacterized protein n=3 Tax=Plasmodium falciparum TaxID=5833 RepID=A0A024XAJ8_PLAFC|nr:hypothetical protein PFFVO_02250 [Plasmodium falciparum Vietnam Oak-Knoll (FVO)]ETW62110.1 hypothetical protein PFMC_02210 [Plasmodium falciparum CAMP/Malaysia]EUR73081.1 hypothetical protein PFBG_02282 [Plasmodium falciparum 7G8]